MPDGRIEIQLELETGEVVKAFAKVETAAQKSADTVEKTFASTLGDGIKKSFKAVGVAAAAALVAAFAAGIAGIGKSIKEGIGAENALNQFNAQLRAAGFFSERTSKSFQDFAKTIQDTTKFTDEQALSFSALSLNYARNVDEAKKLTQAAIALSAATGGRTGVEEAMQQLGGTLNGTVGRLSKLGGGFNQLTVAQLKSGAAMDLVLQRFGSLAGAETKTFEGLINQISKAFDDLSKASGLAIIQSPKLKAALTAILTTIRELTAGTDVNTITKSVSAFVTALANGAKLVASSVLPVFEVVINVVREIVKGFSTAAAFLFEAATGNLKNAVIALASETQTSIEQIASTPISDKVAAVAENISKAVDAAAPTLVGAGQKLGDLLREGMELSNEYTKEIQAAFVTALTGITIGGIESIGASFVKGKGAFKDFGKSVLNLMGSLAIQIGVIISGMGAAIQALATALTNFFTAPIAIAAGIALIALGGALKALAGGGGSSGASSGGGIRSGASGAAGAGDGGTDLADVGQPQGTQLVVNVQGSVFDSDETGLRIADIIKTNFDRRDVRFA